VAKAKHDFACCPAPFDCNDISAIKQKERDLSLIEEGEEKTPPPFSGKRNQSIPFLKVTAGFGSQKLQISQGAKSNQQSAK
jgi:hypothetical protein